MSRGQRSLLLVVTTVCSLAFGGCAAFDATHDSPAAGRAEQQAFEELLQKVRAEYKVPALAAAFVRGNDIVAVAAVGVRRIDQGEPVTINDRFHVGSVSKPISATVIATVVEKGELGWSTTVAEIFPELVGRIDPAYEGVTLEQLLSHRAGIVAWEEDEEIALAPSAAGNPREQRRAAVQWVLNQKPVATPGTEHHYSNAGYMVAAAMAETVTGMAWEDLVHERLAEPLQLESLGFGRPSRIGSDQPWGHTLSQAGFVPQAPTDSYEAGPRLAPAGDLHMNITDLARFAQLHLEGVQGRGRLLSPQTFTKLHQPFDTYALGWNVRETADHHLGGLGTFLASIWVSVPRNVAVVVATNADADQQIVSDMINGTLRTFHVPKP